MRRHDARRSSTEVCCKPVWTPNTVGARRRSLGSVMAGDSRFGVAALRRPTRSDAAPGDGPPGLVRPPRPDCRDAACTLQRDRARVRHLRRSLRPRRPAGDGLHRPDDRLGRGALQAPGRRGPLRHPVRQPGLRALHQARRRPGRSGPDPGGVVGPRSPAGRRHRALPARRHGRRRPGRPRRPRRRAGPRARRVARGSHAPRRWPSGARPRVASLTSIMSTTGELDVGQAPGPTATLS